MNVMVWIWSKDNASHYRVDASKMRTAIVLANEDVRGAVSWQFSTLFRSKPENDATGNDAASLWSRFGRAFFSEIWPLEATLQSARSAKDFAKIPARVGPACFVDAWEAILPYLLPFEVWSVNSEFGLDPKEDATKTILSTFPSQVLTLLAACISERQQHGVFELGRILDQIQVADPELRRDGRMRDLRRSAIEGS